MATGKALNGKPYAGNPHVRFDEGEVASAATPRRGSLLYKKLEIGKIGTGNTSTLATINRLLAAVVLLASGGCQMKEFASTPLYSGDEVKFTGAVEDRVNLWPLAYWREPVGKRCNEVFPIGDEMT